MEICEEKHDRIVHEGHQCPACQLADELQELQKAFTQSEQRVCELEVENDTLKQAQA